MKKIFFLKKDWTDSTLILHIIVQRTRRSRQVFTSMATKCDKSSTSDQTLWNTELVFNIPCWLISVISARSSLFPKDIYVPWYVLHSNRDSADLTLQARKNLTDFWSSLIISVSFYGRWVQNTNENNQLVIILERYICGPCVSSSFPHKVARVYQGTSQWDFGCFHVRRSEDIFFFFWWDVLKSTCLSVKTVFERVA